MWRVLTNNFRINLGFLQEAAKKLLFLQCVIHSVIADRGSVELSGFGEVPRVWPAAHGDVRASTIISRGLLWRRLRTKETLFCAEPNGCVHVLYALLSPE